MKYQCRKVIKILSAKEFDIFTPCDLDLWSNDPKLYLGHLLNMFQHPVKYEGYINMTPDLSKWHRLFFGMCDVFV